MLKPYRSVQTLCAYCRSKLGKVVFKCNDKKFTCSRFCYEQRGNEKAKKELNIPAFTDDVNP